MEPPLSARACRLAGRREVSWLPGLPLRAFPAPRAAQWLRRRGARAARLPRSQWRVRAGFAPASLDHRPLYAAGCYRGPAGTLGGDDGQPHADLHQARRRRRDAPRRHEPRAQDAPADRGLRRRSTSSTPSSAWRSPSTGLPERLRGVAAARPERPVRRRRRPRRSPHGGDRERLRVAPGADDLAGGGAATRSTRRSRRCKSFVLPGRDARRRAAARLPHGLPARRAPRAARARTANPEVVRYLNRLSDLLFILSRGANGGDEPLWEPGSSQERPARRLRRRPPRGGQGRAARAIVAASTAASAAITPATITNDGRSSANSATARGRAIATPRPRTAGRPRRAPGRCGPSTTAAPGGASPTRPAGRAHEVELGDRGDRERASTSWRPGSRRRRRSASARRARGSRRRR